MTAATIQATALRELWIHTGTACNLECPFCLEGSKPGDTRLDRVTLAELKPYFDAAVRLGVQRFAFTGGEPLIVKDIVKILDYALQLKPCLILTNGTAPLIKRVHQLQLLKQKPHALSFRISIDHADEKLHDADRGWGNFKRALDSMKLLLKEGFELSIARHSQAGEVAGEIDARYRQVLRKNELPEDIVIAALPEFGRLGEHHAWEPLTAEKISLSDTHHFSPMCSYSRMVLKRGGEIRVYACALTDDDPSFDMGTQLENSLSQSITLKHYRCHQCLRCPAGLS